MGRIPTTVYLEVDEVKRLEVFASTRKISKSSAIREAIKKLLEIR